jgi:hypothetical protein
MTKKNYEYINVASGDEADFSQGLAWLVAKCRTNQKNKAILAVPSKGALGGVIENVLSRGIVNRLALNKEVFLQDNIRLEVITENQDIYGLDTPILAVFPTKKLLDKIDSVSGSQHVLVIPWSIDEIRYWIDTWNVSALGEEIAGGKKTELTPLVIEALKTLTRHINLSTGLLHPSDKAAAVELILRLKNAGQLIDPDEARRWLVSEGDWRPKDADAFKDLVEKIYAGRQCPVIRGPHWADNILDQMINKTEVI